MKKIRAIAAAGLCLLPVTAHAAFGLWDGCDDVCWSVGVDALYWKSCQCPFDYGELRSNVLSPTPVTESQMLRVKPGYEWGFRVWIGAERDCTFATLDWTYYSDTDLSIANAGDNNLVVVPNLANATRAVARMKTRYNKINLRLGYYFHRGCDIDFYTFAGLRYLDLDSLRNVVVQAVSDEDSLKQIYQWDGFGVEVGLGTDYHIGCGFHLAGYIAGIGALGHQKTRADMEGQGAGGTPSRWRYPTYVQCLPGVEFRLGFNYTYVCGCWQLKGEIGYQLDYYFDMFSIKDGDSDFSRCIDVGFAGPFIGLSLQF